MPTYCDPWPVNANANEGGAAGATPDTIRFES